MFILTIFKRQTSGFRSGNRVTMGYYIDNTHDDDKRACRQPLHALNAAIGAWWPWLPHI
jgi:hypothetical protein